MTVDRPSAAIARLAEAVETKFAERGLKVTMGGEPTFIVADPEGDEWNQGAMGPEKLGYARRLARKFTEALYPGALVMQVFGKQYPGEPLPRWVVSVLHREDGEPLWRAPERLLLDDVPGTQPESSAKKLIVAIGEALVDTRGIVPCVEPEAMDAHRGWVLPLDWSEGAWVTEVWPRWTEEPIALVPGKSPIGLRLPLQELEEPHLRRALTVEVVDGAIHLFVPPLPYEAFCDLISRTERITSELEMDELIFCGYRPSDAEALTMLGLAADPGVLEVNLPPTRRWQDYDRLLAEITRVAATEGLRTTRYHLNGEVQGTGGGAHVLFGGPSLDENPFFADPKLLASMIRYWQRHPALAYFFSGQYVGPGSQAPRPDETVLSRLYELEMACEGVDAAEDQPEEREFLDRMFRNLMTDGAGNTHRAEICLDKLWNFDSPTGLQGLVELRAFETMPDVRDQSLAALFVRAILAMLASDPHEAPLIRFGHALHDAFMLPSVIWQDLGTICDDLNRVGLPFDRQWLASTFDHRFSRLGTLPLANGEVVVRQALEPWPLMAEIASGGSTSRVVDNSTDRIEVSVSEDALRGGRVAVNGCVLQLRQVDGLRAGGVRYKSASGWPALHPHLSSQSPLTIEVLDPSNVVVAAASYHHWNPDGPAYDGRPADLDEALARQRERWIQLPDAVGGARQPKEVTYPAESPHTLDLRREPSPRDAKD